ncbi:hypothetical protein [Paraburkholderia rhizosphaerae]|uniref:Uncharacterized protein n=1 Tax=Paraburkholderia rhizosphaerae TaxID=480658 RepID=A0A4R8LLK2_9BURK|nr:hypothetical protein [Paraburkholderia rhizosphaerae]TDY43887.1 hypothetical protein BX592_11789 [Paraburkholderia rhizosphaerae]
MRIWLGLLAAPAVVLGTQSANYALLQLACRRQSMATLHVVSIAAILFSVAAALLAYRCWRESSPRYRASYVPRGARSAFLSLMAAIVAALCAVVQLAMYFPQWLLSPCQ